MANVSDLAEGHSPDPAAPRRGLARNLTEVDYYQLETLESGCVGTEGSPQENTPTGGGEREGLLVSGSRGEGRRSPAALRVHFEKSSSPGGGEEEEDEEAEEEKKEEVRAAVSETVL